jgi:UDP-glucose 4-epimerase
MLAESFFRSFATPVVTLRPFNTYGPRQSTRAIVPTILSQLIAGKRQIFLGSLAPKRDMVFVKDTASAFLLALKTPRIEGEVIHFGTNRTVSVEELADLCCRVMGRSAEICADPKRIRPPDSEVQVLKANSTRAMTLIGWEPMTSLEEGIRITAEFIERHMDLYDPDVYSI